MQSGLGALLRFIGRNLLSLLAIACILVLGQLALEEWRAHRAAQSQLATLSEAEQPVRALADSASTSLAKRVATYKDAPIAALDARIAQLQASLQSSDGGANETLLTFPLPDGGQMAERVVAQYAKRIDIAAMRQELAYLAQLRAYASAGMDKHTAQQHLNQLHAAHVAAYANYSAHTDSLRTLSWMERQLLDVPGLRSPRLTALARERAQLVAENNRAYRAWHAQRTALAHISKMQDMAAFAVNPAQMESVIAPLQRDIASARTAVSASWISRIVKPVGNALPTAALVLLVIFITHLAVKAFFYYVLAPLATRLRPVRLSANASGELGQRGPGTPGAGVSGGSSAVSQPVSLLPSERLLILPDYVQSVPAGGRKRTYWLLDWSHPWTSLVSGMFALTSIQTSDAEPVVLSASEDASSELALITLPEGAAMVFQPRCLVGVIVDDAHPLSIRSHWRLGTLHAWLTLQLRYLVFDGPATLVVRGSRGVRVEAAGRGRLISQEATLGFSANLDYSTVRSDTFFPYYMGHVALLQDRFTGGPGHYVYDETPRGGKQGNIASRGLEGLMNGVLKAFGI